MPPVNCIKMIDQKLWPRAGRPRNVNSVESSSDRACSAECLQVNYSINNRVGPGHTGVRLAQPGRQVSLGGPPGIIIKSTVRMVKRDTACSSKWELAAGGQGRRETIS
eukprot:g83312.t1